MFPIARLAVLVPIGVVCLSGQLLLQAQPSPTSTAVIRGRLVAADTNVPLRDATVDLQSLSAEARPVTRIPAGGSIVLDAEGRFEIAGVAPGQYRLIVYPGPTAAPYIETRYPNPASDPPQWLDVAHGQIVEDLVIPVLRGAVISGRIVDELGNPQAMVMVTVREPQAVERQRPPSGFVPARSDRTDDLGAFRIFGLPPGEYLVVAQPPRSGPSVPKAGSFTLENPPAYYPGTLSAADARRVRVRAGEEHGPIELALQRARLQRFEGMLVDSAGTPVPGAKITLQRRTSPLGEGVVAVARTGADGMFELSGAPAGDHALSAYLYGGEHREFAWLPVPPDADLDRLTLRLQPGVRLDGDLVFEGSRPDSLVPVLVRPVGGIGSNPSPPCNRMPTAPSRWSICSARP
jgi:Carboxypeptidase regulatory-like domain